MELETFWPKYPHIFRKSEDILNPYNLVSFGNAITTKKEFSDLTLEKDERVPDKKGILFKHQKIISRFLSSVTPYNELFLFHEMGTGKTCTSIGVLEQIKQERGSTYTGAAIFAEGSNLLKNFLSELLFKCTDGRYVPENYDSITELEQAHRVKKTTGEFYKFSTFEKFIKEFKMWLSSEIKSCFNNYIIVIDEVHNLRSREIDHEVTVEDETTDTLEIYRSFHTFLHTVENCKILLLSGTPMKDSPSEVANVFNLILPMNKQLVYGKEFMDRYYTEDEAGCDGVDIS